MIDWKTCAISGSACLDKSQTFFHHVSHGAGAAKLNRLKQANHSPQTADKLDQTSSLVIDSNQSMKNLTPSLYNKRYPFRNWFY
ncbi:hypothetical protein O181_030759 [Austropuccinia psidii MF-1]|uniref:Uncharacterized protein n=1 Tax=Austropuccinia psidii MF-1 TaxID=1389203 RepID=A0A9Q3CUI4_9BASI|nr:hypothetical protein [Austropuccinia psidii MF-1]